MEARVSPCSVVDPLYPDSDGKPMADNTLQFAWIVKIKSGLDAAFADDPDVFVAGDILWYAVQGSPAECVAPDVLVAFGRPKDEYRGSYKQWAEQHVAPQVVFEVLSPSNTDAEMARKLAFYDRNGVEEYYVIDPEEPGLTAYARTGGQLQEVPYPVGWVSPRLGGRFELAAGELTLYGPDGRPFVSPAELAAQRDEAEQAADDAHDARVRAEQAAERLRQQLRALGIEPAE